MDTDLLGGLLCVGLFVGLPIAAILVIVVLPIILFLVFGTRCSDGRIRSGKALTEWRQRERMIQAMERMADGSRRKRQ
jgi:hypothetical protein